MPREKSKPSCGVRSRDVVIRDHRFPMEFCGRLRRRRTPRRTGPCRDARTAGASSPGAALIRDYTPAEFPVAKSGPGANEAWLAWAADPPSGTSAPDAAPRVAGPAGLPTSIPIARGKGPGFIDSSRAGAIPLDGTSPRVPDQTSLGQRPIRGSTLPSVRLETLEHVIAFRRFTHQPWNFPSVSASTGGALGSRAFTLLTGPRRRKSPQDELPLLAELRIVRSRATSLACRSYHGETVGASEWSPTSLLQDAYASPRRGRSRPPDFRQAPGESPADRRPSAAAALKLQLEAPVTIDRRSSSNSGVGRAAGMATIRNICGWPADLADRHAVHLIWRSRSAARTSAPFSPMNKAGIRPGSPVFSYSPGGYLPLSVVLSTETLYGAPSDDTASPEAFHSIRVLATPGSPGGSSPVPGPLSLKTTVLAANRGAPKGCSAFFAPRRSRGDPPPRQCGPRYSPSTREHPPTLVLRAASTARPLDRSGPGQTPLGIRWMDAAPLSARWKSRPGKCGLRGPRYRGLTD